MKAYFFKRMFGLNKGIYVQIKTIDWLLLLYLAFSVNGPSISMFKREILVLGM